MRFRLSARLHRLPYLFGLILAFCAATVQFAAFAKFGVSNLIHGIIKFINPNTVSTPGTIYTCIQTFLGYMFYVALILLFVVAGIIIWDFFRKKPEEAVISKEIIFALDFAKMTPKQIAAFMDRVKDMSSAQIETFFGGQYLEVIKEATKHTKIKTIETPSKTKKENKKGGKRKGQKR